MPRVAPSVELRRLSLGPAARMLGVDPDTLRRWADDGLVEAFVTPGGHRRFDRTEIDRLLDARHPGTGTVPPLAARHVHEEFEDTPCIDKGFFVLVGNNEFALQAIKDGAPERPGVAAAIIRDIVKQMHEDIPIWENKRYLDAPKLCDGDGPIGAYRAWTRQFYGTIGERPARPGA